MKKLYFLTLLSFFVFPDVLSQESWIPGSVVKKQSFSDSSQYYSIFIPSDFSSLNKYPILFAMDPRGNATLPLERFKNAADSLSYIIISSHNTQSDTDPQVTITAINTMINDSFQILPVDTTRFYLAGFSGTARISWVFGYEIPNYISGIIGVGAGSGNGFSLPDAIKNKGIPFNYYGASGFEDFNYYELLDLDTYLTKTDFPHHISFFDGGHRWPDSNILNDALYWIELMEMKQGKIDTDSLFVQNLFNDWKKKANLIKSKGDYYHLILFLKSMSRTFDSFHFIDVSIIDQINNEIEKSIDIENLNNSVSILIANYYSYANIVQKLFEKYQNEERTISFSEIDEILKISYLINQKNTEPDIYKLRSIKVLLELVYVQSNFYQTNLYMADKKYENAKIMLQIADSIKKNQPRVCYNLARVHSQLKEWDEAIEALKCIQNMSWYRNFIIYEPLLEPLRNTKQFKKFTKN